MDEYDPDKPEVQKREPSGSLEDRPRVAIDDRRPWTEDHPRYPEKFELHRKRGVVMMLCPECKHMGRHEVCEDDQPVTAGASRIAGEICDICGAQDTYEMGF